MNIVSPTFIEWKLAPEDMLSADCAAAADGAAVGFLTGRMDSEPTKELEGLVRLLDSCPVVVAFPILRVDV